MKAVTYSEYGRPDVLRFIEIEKPAPAVRAVAVYEEAPGFGV